MNYKIGNNYILKNEDEKIIVQLKYIFEDLIEYKKYWAIFSYKEKLYSVPLNALEKNEILSD